MPHVGSSSTEDLASSDEIKSFKDEGEDETPASVEVLKELKTSLITEGDQKSSQSFTSKTSGSQQPPTLQNGQRVEGLAGFGKAFDTPLGYSPFGYSLPHSPYHPNGAFSPMTNKMAAVDSGSLPFMMPNMERLPQPPPAHMGIPPVHIETKAVSISWMDAFASGIARNPLYGQYPSSVLTDLTQQLQWTNPAIQYQLQSAAAFRGPYHPPLSSSAPFTTFGRTPIMPHPSFSGHSFSPSSFLQAPSSSNVNGGHIGNGSTSQKSSSRPSSSLVNGANLLANGAAGGSATTGTGSSNRLPGTTVSLNATNSANAIRGDDLKSRVNSGPSNGNKAKSSHSMSQSERDQKIHQVKKPLNAFMIFMKEERARVIAETTMKESAQINQILGKKWHNLTRTEQEKYYEKARKEKELHMERHPGWTAKDNYAINGKRKKKKRERNADGERGAAKKCRARYGLDQQNQWCKPCRRKKKCVRVYQESRRGRTNSHEDNLGSVGSVDAPTPESKSANESDHDNLNLSSTDLSLSSPPAAEFHPFMNSFSHYSSGSAINPPSSSHLHLNGNGHLGSPGLFYPHASSSSTSLSSPLGSRMSSLLTPNSPLTAVSAGLGPFATSLPCSSATALHSTSHSQVPPRNSPFSIEQLARPHCPSSQNRSSPLSSSSSIGSSTSKQSHEVNVPVITSLPTPPSSTDSTASVTPAMLSVA